MVVFNLGRLRRRDLIHSFLAFCRQNVERIGNLDQSLLNYFFGKHIVRLDPCWNRPPYHADAAAEGRIVHFHGPKPWDVGNRLWQELRTACYWPLRDAWLDYLFPDEREEVEAWCDEQRR